MENILVVLPKSWNIKKIRYLQLGEEVQILDVDALDSTPWEEVDSLYNYRWNVLKKNGPTGFLLTDKIPEYLAEKIDSYEPGPNEYE